MSNPEQATLDVAIRADREPYLADPRELRQMFLDIVQQRRLHAVFQPILDFRARGYLGFEGLIRGPVDGPLHSPIALFRLAHEMDINTEFERLCREVVLRSFAELRLPGRLFINISVNCLADPHCMNGRTLDLLADLELIPQQIVIELTENQQVADFSVLRDVLATCRKQGYQIAVDDLGEGFSNLRMWSEVRPEFVKIDRHFISGIAEDALKFKLVRAIQDIGEASGTTLIAEGIETAHEFTTVRDMGIEFGQGFLIARPAGDPAQSPTQDIADLLAQGRVVAFPNANLLAHGDNTARRIMHYMQPVAPTDENDAIYARFESEPDLIVLPVVDADGVPRGLINRHSLIDRFARPYRRELYGRKPCTLLMNPRPVVVDHTASIQEIGQLLGQSAHRDILDGFVVTENGRYVGIGSAQVLMAVITDLQIRAARYANPLTQLPGNVPVNEHIDRLLSNTLPFAAAYCDLDHFKPYNDVYGYRRGDQLIQILGQILGQLCEPRLDFLGHIGGDDFMLLLQSEDWHRRLEDALRLFDEVLPDFIEAAHIQRGGYEGEDRRGQPIFHALPALSIGCLVVEPDIYHSHHEVSRAVTVAKKQAKKMGGSSLFIERRRGHLAQWGRVDPTDAG